VILGTTLNPPAAFEEGQAESRREMALRKAAPPIARSRETVRSTAFADAGDAD
jgi:hypothetical protein